jgi:5-methylcytosine-specific restriction endonuclease McrA
MNKYKYQTLQIKQDPRKPFQRYYVHVDGYIYKIYGGREIVLPVRIKNQMPLVEVYDRDVSLIFLLLEYFDGKIYKTSERQNTRFKFKCIDGRYPLKHIRIITRTSTGEDGSYKMYKYKCKEKASSANSRVRNISSINELDVFNSLQRMKYRCNYCNYKLDHKTWELDHFQPLSQGGLNTPENITPSCKPCNRMKGGMEINAFLHKVFSIKENYNDAYIMERPTISKRIKDKVSKNRTKKEI